MVNTEVSMKEIDSFDDYIHNNKSINNKNKSNKS